MRIASYFSTRGSSTCAFLGGLAAAFGLFSCSGESGDDAGEASGGSAGNSVTIVPTTGGSTGSVGSGGSAVVTSGGTNGGCFIEDDGSSCVGQSFETEGVPLDIYVMFDQSGSMCSCVDPVGGQLCPDPACRETRLDGVRRAMDTFLADPASAGIGVGIGYFGTQPIGQAVCDSAVYSQPSVPIAPLPQNAGAVLASLSGIAPTGETPTAAALRGACAHAREFRAENPGHKLVLLLLTDGKPEAPVTCRNGAGPCCPTLEDAVLAASECHDGGLGIDVYVLGVGPLLQNLDQIAKAGGTSSAYLVEGGDVAGEVLGALNAIRSDAIPCELELPQPPVGETLALDQVNVTHASAACEPTHLSYVGDVTGCRVQGGWHYDDAANPKTIQLCDTSCDQVRVPGSRLFYTVGCARNDDIPR
jgi:hypothetical protein